MNKHSITDFYIFAGVMAVIGKHMQVTFVQVCDWEGGGATAAARVLDASNEN